MLRSCKYCGRVHDSKARCSQQPVTMHKRYHSATQDAFRSSPMWQAMRDSVKDRDDGMCQCCYRNMTDTTRRINADGVSVHHIIPLAEAFDKRLDSTNLLTVCDMHHRQCESGDISRTVQLSIAAEQESKRKTTQFL